MRLLRSPLFVGSVAAYCMGAIATALLLIAISRTYIPYDSPAVVFVHDRLPNALRNAHLFMLTAGAWFAGFIGLIVSLTRTPVRFGRTSIAGLVCIQAIVGMLFAALPIAIDSDQYAYVGYAYTASVGNPYTPPSIGADAPEATRQAAQHWGNPLPVDRYGGAWTALNEAVLQPFRAAPLRLQVGVLRIAALLAACAVSIVIALALRERSLAAVAAFAINPLVILECANGAHNDIFLVLAGVAALYAYMQRRFGFAGLLMGLAVAVKFAYAPFVVPLAVGARSAAARVIFGFLAVVVLCTAPFGLKQAGLTAPAGSFERTSGTIGLLARILRHVPLIHNHAVAVVDAVVLTALAVCIVALTVDAWHGRIAATVAILTALLLLVVPGKLEPWYVLITAPLVLLPVRSGGIAFIAFCAGGLVLVQSSFTGIFPLIPAIVIALVVAVVMRAALELRLKRALPA